MRLLLIVLFLVAAALPRAAAAQGTVGEVQFENGGNPAAQAPFRRGLALLHNFEYSAAAAAFREAQAADPGFAMAFWGEAMTYNHPLWAEQDTAKARSALQRLAADQATRAARAPSQREKLYLAAVEALYGDGTKHERDFLYSAAMEEIHRLHPDDVDGRAFYALSLLGLAHQGRDPALYMRAAALLEEIFPQNLRHPGVLHYLIHSYDDPVHAPLGLRAARLYGAVAPEAGHALHMTSHIFLALGLWDEVADANQAAIATVDRQRAAAGRAPSACGHYAEWLVYADYQRGRPEDADRAVDSCRREAESELASSLSAPGGRSAVASFADMALRRLVETGRWDGPLALPEDGYPAARVSFAYGALLAAGADANRVREARSDLEQAWAAFAASEGDDMPPAERRRGEILLAQAAGLEAFHAGEADPGLAAIARAAETERQIPAEFGPPLVEKPSNELLGDLMAGLGRAEEAKNAYRAALALAPGRRLSARGLRPESASR